MSDNITPICAVLTHNAADHITDWLSWHLAIGFKRIIVIDHQSDDGTKELVQSLTHTHPIEYHQPPVNESASPIEKRLILMRDTLRIFKDIQENSSTQHWFSLLDSDEFLEPHPNLLTLLKRYHHQKAIFINWCCFGDNLKKRLSKQHIIATHQWRADKLFSDHQFGRVLFQFSALPEINTITDLQHLNISPKDIIASDGTSYNPSSSKPIWEGARLLHYVRPLKTPSSTIAPLLNKYYNNKQTHDITPQKGLYRTRQFENNLLKDHLQNGIEKLKLWAEDYTKDDKRFHSDHDLKLPEFAERPGFNYARIRPSRHHRYLLSEQANPARSNTEIFLLQNTTNHNFLTADELNTKKDTTEQNQKPKPLLALIQESHPSLISLFFEDRAPFILGDVPTPYHVGVILAQRSHHHLFTLPEETGHANALFRAVAYHKTPPQLGDILPLPLADDGDGISVDTLLLWIEHHPQANINDIYRALRLLSQSASRLIIEVIPQFRPFLP